MFNQHFGAAIHAYFHSIGAVGMQLGIVFFVHEDGLVSTIEHHAQRVFTRGNWAIKAQCVAKMRRLQGCGEQKFIARIDRQGLVRWPLKRQPFLLETSRPGVFAAGDVRAGSMKRVASAVAEGAMAVECIRQYLKGA